VMPIFRPWEQLTLPVTPKATVIGSRPEESPTIFDPRVRSDYWLPFLHRRRGRDRLKKTVTRHLREARLRIPKT
jgi:hypothetical protein